MSAPGRDYVGDAKITALLDEAERAGDKEQASLCRLALSGSTRARAKCDLVIADAAAQVEHRREGWESRNERRIKAELKARIAELESNSIDPRLDALLAKVHDPHEALDAYIRDISKYNREQDATIKGLREALRPFAEHAKALSRRRDTPIHTDQMVAIRFAHFDDARRVLEPDTQEVEQVRTPTFAMACECCGFPYWTYDDERRVAICTQCAFESRDEYEGHEEDIERAEREKGRTT